MRSLLSPLFVSLRTPPLALRNVMQGRVRSAVAIVGIGFAVVMVLLQLGFLEAVKITAAINYDQLDFDVALVSTEFEQFYDPGSFPRERLVQAQSVPSVTAARPLWARMNVWRCPPYPVDAAVDAAVPDMNALKRWWLGAQRPGPCSAASCSCWASIWTRTRSARRSAIRSARLGRSSARTAGCS